ncbi:MAG: thiamine-phosphate kinase [Candidatus Omnitrophica bacterium]|nr:thiamine-phosphate kinase [Candidatus Omnitrophota bacterium]
MPCSEFKLIAGLKKFQNLSARVVHGIGDDAAVLELDARRYQLFTADMIVEGVHFVSGTPARLVGHKALACNISDIAAMGGSPTCAVISLGLPAGLPVSYVNGLYAGMRALAQKFGVSIVGGDTVRSAQLVINIALLGEIEKKRLVLRSGARPGDLVFVTGPLGGTLQSGKHLNFIPRVKEARFLTEHFKPSAMMDISDGLAGDLGHILKASRVGAVIQAAQVPLNKGVGLAEALHGGEDFELVFCLASLKAHKLLQYARSRGACRFYEIGRIVAGPQKLALADQFGRCRMIELKGYTHF